jgi:hypothetical protein
MMNKGVAMKAMQLFLLVLIGTAFSQNWWDDNGGSRDGLDFDMDPEYCDTEGWEIIYDGTPQSATENLWLSNASHGSGGNWWVDTDPDGEATDKLAPGQLVLWSTQNPGGDGGLAYTHRLMENMECEIKFWPGWANDGGIFFRSNGNGGAYQIMLDYQPGNTVGGIWPEGISASMQKLYSFQAEDQINAEGITWPASDWPDIWDPDGYNLVSGKVFDESYIIGYVHDPDHVITDYEQGGNAGGLNSTGYVGFQIHAGEGAWTGGPNKYLYIKIRELDDNGDPICNGTKTSVCNISGYAEYDATWDTDDTKLGDPSKCLNFGTPVISGCTDPLADNPTSGAEQENGSCLYTGCTNSEATNYFCTENATAFPCVGSNDYAIADITDDGNCVVGVKINGINGPLVQISRELVSVKFTGNHSIQVVNVDGVSVLSETGEGNAVYGLSDLQAGIYFVTVNTGIRKFSEKVLIR